MRYNGSMNTRDMAAYMREYRRTHPEATKQWAKNAMPRQRQLRWQRRLEALAAYGGTCTCCGETEITFLTIDHVENDGAAHRRQPRVDHAIGIWLRRNGYPPGFQVLCWNCNLAKALYGNCPHQTASTA